MSYEIHKLYFIWIFHARGYRIMSLWRVFCFTSSWISEWRDLLFRTGNSDLCFSAIITNHLRTHILDLLPISQLGVVFKIYRIIWGKVTIIPYNLHIKLSIRDARFYIKDSWRFFNILKLHGLERRRSAANNLCQFWNGTVSLFFLFCGVFNSHSKRKTFIVDFVWI